MTYAIIHIVVWEDNLVHQTLRQCTTYGPKTYIFLKPEDKEKGLNEHLQMQLCYEAFVIAFWFSFRKESDT